MNQTKASTKTIAVTQCLSRPADMVWQLIRSGRDVHRMMPLENYEGSIHVTDLGGGTCEVLWFATYNLLDEGADGAVRDGLLGLLRTAIGGMGALVAAA